MSQSGQYLAHIFQPAIVYDDLEDRGSCGLQIYDVRRSCWLPQRQIAVRDRDESAELYVREPAPRFNDTDTAAAALIWCLWNDASGEQQQGDALVIFSVHSDTAELVTHANIEDFCWLRGNSLLVLGTGELIRQELLGDTGFGPCTQVPAAGACIALVPGGSSALIVGVEGSAEGRSLRLSLFETASLVSKGSRVHSIPSTAPQPPRPRPFHGGIAPAAVCSSRAIAVSWPGMTLLFSFAGGVIGACTASFKSMSSPALSADGMLLSGVVSSAVQVFDVRRGSLVTSLPNAQASAEAASVSWAGQDRLHIGSYTQSLKGSQYVAGQHVKEVLFQVLRFV